MINMDKVSNTGDRIRQWLDNCGLRQVDLLRKAEPYCEQYNIKLVKNELSQYVNHVRTPRPDKLVVLAKAMNVSEIWLLGYDVPINYTVTLGSEPTPQTKRDLLIQEAHKMSEAQIDKVLRLIEIIKSDN